MTKRIKQKRIRFCDSQIRTIFSALIVDEEWFSFTYRFSDQSSFVRAKSSYFKKYEPIDVDTEKLSTFSTISFKKFDQVQQRRFYRISYPVIRRKLWLSSKQTSNLGLKPHYMITSCVKGMGIENSDEEAEDPDDPLVILKEQFLRNEISNFANIVLSFGPHAMFTTLDSVDFWELTKYVQFSQTDTSFYDSEIDNLELSLVCHPKTWKLHSVWAEIDFEYALNSLPQLKELSIHDDLVVGWENHVLEWNIQNLEKLWIRADSITEFEILKKIVLKMSPGSKHMTWMS